METEITETNKTNLPDLPTEIVQRIIYLGVAPKDFINLGLVSKELNLVCNLINYPGFVNYDNIKNIKEKSKFKSIKLTHEPKNGDLEIISPTLLVVDYTSSLTNPLYQTQIFEEPPEKDTVIKKLELPDSVIGLKIYDMDLILDSEKNSRLEDVVWQSVKIVGSIPNSIKRMEISGTTFCDFDSFTNPENLIYFSLSAANTRLERGTDYYIKFIYPSVLNFLKRTKKLETLRLLLVTLNYLIDPNIADHVYEIPVLPYLQNISIEIRGYPGEIRLDFGNNPYVKKLQIITEQVVVVLNPPTNLEWYQVSLVSNNLNNPNILGNLNNTKKWNSSLNISAEEVDIISIVERIEYICDNRIKYVKLSGEARAKFSETCRTCTMDSHSEIEILDTKNIDAISISAPATRINLGKTKLAYLSASEIIITDYATEIETLNITTVKIKGNINSEKFQTLLVNPEADISELLYFSDHPNFRLLLNP